MAWGVAPGRRLGIWLLATDYDDNALRAGSGIGRIHRSVALLSDRWPTLPSGNYGDARSRDDVDEVILDYQPPAGL